MQMPARWHWKRCEIVYIRNRIISGMWLDASIKDPLKLGFCKQPVAAGKGTGNRLYDIAPGHADASVLAFRMDSDDPSVMMPELGRSVVHREGVRLIRQWIDAQHGNCDSRTRRGAAGFDTPGFGESMTARPQRRAARRFNGREL